MSVLRNSRMSDILAATGKAGMQAGAGEKFWNWRRIVLSIGYALVFLTGLQILLAADPTALILMLTAVAGVLFMHRTWLGVLVWTYVLVSGVVAITSGDDLGFYGVVAAIAFGLVALPIWSRRPAAPKPVYYWQQSPFMAPAPAPEGLETPVPEASSQAPNSSEPSTSIAPLKPMLRTIGRIQIATTAGDLTSDLMRKPVVGFLWLYLLARSVWKPGDRVTRTAITDEVAHGVSDPRRRLRGYLFDLSHLKQPIGSMVQIEDELVGFDLGGVDADFVELPTLAQRVRDSKGPLAKDLVGAAQALLLELGAGEFLPGFEEMERRVTNGRGVAGQVVAEARVQIDNMRADVAVAVGEALLDRGLAAQAAALLEPIAKRSENRDDIARTLSTALRELGQHDRAAEVRRCNAVGRES
jgi:hypothetical protein